MLRIYLLGQMRFVSDGAELSPPHSQKARILLARLAVQGGNLSREILAEALWEGGLPSARVSLNTEVTKLRRSLGADAGLLASGRDYLGLPPSPELWIDVRELSEHVRQGEHEEAIALFAGTFLQDTKADAWVTDRREHYGRMSARALGQFAGQAEAEGRLPEAIELTRRAREFDPENPQATIRLITLLVASGDLMTAESERQALLARFASKGLRIPEPVLALARAGVSEAEPATRQGNRVERNHRNGNRKGTPAGGELAAAAATTQTVVGEQAAPRPGTGASWASAPPGPVFTGLVDLDRLLGGLPEPGLTVLAGRPAMGTTALALTIAMNASVELGVATALISTEMSETQLAQQLVGMRARVSQGDLRHGRVQESRWPKILNASQAISEAPVSIDVATQLDVGEVVERVRVAARERHARLVVLDSIHGISNEGDRALDGPSVARAVIALRDAAREHDLAILVTIEVLGDCEKRADKRPKLGDLPGHYELGARPDAVLLLYRDDYYDAESEQPGVVEIDVAETRQGDVGRISVTIDPRTARVANLAPAESDDAHVDPGAEQEMLEAIYEPFAARGNWPLFQYVTAAMWQTLKSEPRETYHRLSARALVRPIVSAERDFQLRENTQVAISLRGLMLVPSAAEDLRAFLTAIRHIGTHAAEFRPKSPSEVEQPILSSESICAAVGIDPAGPAAARLGSLLRDEAWHLSSGFGWQDDGPWTMNVIPERARNYQAVESLEEFIALHPGGGSG